MMLHFHDLPDQDDRRLPPPPAAALDSLWDALGVPVDTFYVELYRAFGGYAAPDANMVTLWPVERIVAERALSTAIDGERHFAIGDVMIDSDFLMVRLDDAQAPAILLYAGDEVAPSARDLVERALAGRFDVMPDDRTPSPGF